MVKRNKKSWGEKLYEERFKGRYAILTSGHKAKIVDWVSTTINDIKLKVEIKGMGIYHVWSESIVGVSDEKIK